MWDLLRGEYWLLGFAVGLGLITLNPHYKRKVIVIPDPDQESQWQFRDLSGGLFEIQSRPVLCRFAQSALTVQPQEGQARAAAAQSARAKPEQGGWGVSPHKENQAG
jgi:hypothetical protein